MDIKIGDKVKIIDLGHECQDRGFVVGGVYEIVDIFLFRRNTEYVIKNTENNELLYCKITKIENGYDVQIQKYEENNTSTIAGITGKGDLSKKPHPRALNPDFNIEIAKVFRFGQQKHGVDNFRTMTQEASGEIIDAMQRHLLAYLSGETHADDSKLHHLAHAAANLHMLYRLIKRHGDKEVLKIISGGDIQ